MMRCSGIAGKDDTQATPLVPHRDEVLEQLFVDVKLYMIIGSREERHAGFRCIRSLLDLTPVATA